MALGARPRDIMSLVLGEGLGLTVAGLGLGLAVSVAVTFGPNGGVPVAVATLLKLVRTFRNTQV